MRYFLGFFLALLLPCVYADTAWIYPPVLKPGDTVELLSPSFRIDNDAVYSEAVKRLQSLGLNVVVGRAVLGHDGYFAGSDDARAADINAAFANPNIKAIFAIRGGFGSTHLLDKLNYSLIAQHPKILIGFSDVTALLLAIHDKTGLVTFHGPMPGAFTWPRYTTQQLKAALFNHSPMTLQNPPGYPIKTITPGEAQGVLLGGNLTVLAALIGTPYLPTDWHGKILFLEDTHEDAYQMDRMLTQLTSAHILTQVSGVVFGTCTSCTTEIPGSPSVFEVVKQHLQPLHIPAFYGAMIGHQSMIWTVPEGVSARMDATHGTITIGPTP